MILWNIVPPVIQDATYTKHVYQDSKHYVGVGSCIKGGTMLQRQKTENVAFLSLLFYINNRVLWLFLCTILHEIWQIPFILSNYNLPMQRIVYFDKF